MPQGFKAPRSGKDATNSPSGTPNVGRLPRTARKEKGGERGRCLGRVSLSPTVGAPCWRSPLLSYHRKACGGVR